MQINADLTQPASADTARLEWIDSPLPGVQRKMLDRDGDEVARATSLVRYAPGSHFDPHVHGGGEEFLVLEGTFSDEHGDYPAGTYVRNPVGSRHRPFSRDGCVILVKLRQMAPADQTRVVVDTRNERLWQQGPAAGIRIVALHRFGRERVALASWPAGAAAPIHEHAGGLELLVLEGELEDGGTRYGEGAWLRLPPGSRHAPASKAGCRLYVKAGHLL